MVYGTHLAGSHLPIPNHSGMITSEVAVWLPELVTAEVMVLIPKWVAAEIVSQTFIFIYGQAIVYLYVQFLRVKTKIQI